MFDGELLLINGTSIYIIILILSYPLIYIFQGLSLIKMAKTAGHPKPFLAWIPFAATYLLATLPKNRFKFCGIAFYNRTVSYFLIIPVCVIVPFLLELSLTIADVDKMDGHCVFISLLFFLLYYFIWRKDLLETFRCEKAMLFSLLSVIFPFLWPIFIFISRNNMPVYGEGMYTKILEEGITERLEKRKKREELINRQQNTERQYIEKQMKAYYEGQPEGYKSILENNYSKVNMDDPSEFYVGKGFTAPEWAKDREGNKNP